MRLGQTFTQGSLKEADFEQNEVKVPTFPESRHITQLRENRALNAKFT